MSLNLRTKKHTNTHRGITKRWFGRDIIFFLKLRHIVPAVSLERELALHRSSPQQHYLLNLFLGGWRKLPRKISRVDFNAQKAPLQAAAYTDAWRTRCDELDDVAIAVHYCYCFLHVSTGKVGWNEGGCECEFYSGKQMTILSTPLQDVGLMGRFTHCVRVGHQWLTISSPYLGTWRWWDDGHYLLLLSVKKDITKKFTVDILSSH